MSNSLITSDLFSKILVEPSEQANHLYIVSGYSSSAMAFHHAEKLRYMNKNVFIHLIIGMTGKDGISKANHEMFKKFMEEDLHGRFECSYLINSTPVHSKVYAWVKDSTPIMGFAGSANYSQQAFVIKNQREIITACESDDAYNYYQNLISDTVFCTHQDAEEIISLYHNDYYQRNINSNQFSIENESIEKQSDYFGLRHVKASLIDKNGGIYCLNWGHRKNGTKRNLNQAYIQLQPHIYKSDFFPLNQVHFTILTDDGKPLVCTRAQKSKTMQGCAIETPHNNSLLGQYFRHRLGLENGAYITKDNLIKYGRTDIDFYKIDEENYYMDFSVNSK